LGDMNLFSTYQIENLGMRAHYQSMGRGVLDSRDILYFLSIAFFFLYLTKIKFDQK